MPGALDFLPVVRMEIESNAFGQRIFFAQNCLMISAVEIHRELGKLEKTTVKHQSRDKLCLQVRCAFISMRAI